MALYMENDNAIILSFFKFYTYSIVFTITTGKLDNYSVLLRLSVLPRFLKG